MSLAVEICVFPPTEAYRKDATLIAPVAQFVKEAAGCLGAYYGTQVEDQNKSYLFVVWESVEKHYDLIKDAAVYPKLKDALAICVEGGLAALSMFHVTATGSVAAALNAPFTAITAITKLKEGKTGADLQGDLNALINAKAPPGAHGGYFGRLVERDEYILSTGWDSIDQHIGAITGDEVVKKAVESAAATIAERSLVHVTLTPYFKYQG